jgi:integrase
VFLTLMLTAVRNHEIRNLGWAEVDLVECVLRVSDSKSEDGIRSIAMTSALVDALARLKERSPYDDDHDYVFADHLRGARLDPTWFAGELRAALAKAGIAVKVRPFHDWRHNSLTHEAAAGSNPIALKTKAGHSSMQTTGIHLHLAGTVFLDEAEALEQRLLGGRTFYPSDVTSADHASPRVAQEAAVDG